MRNAFQLALILVSIAGAQSAMAATLVDGIPLYNGAFFQTSSPWVDLTEVGTTQTLKAVGRVETITASGSGVALWQSAPSTPELTFVLSGFTAAASTPLPGGVVVSGFEGGTLRLYVDPARNAYLGLGAPFNPESFADGNLFLELSPRVRSVGALPQASLIGAYSMVGSDGPGVISASGVFDVVGGMAAQFFDTNRYLVDGEVADLLFGFSVGLQQPLGEWRYRGAAHLSGSTVVPLPGSLPLMASAITAAITLKRRRAVGQKLLAE